MQGGHAPEDFLSPHQLTDLTLKSEGLKAISKDIALLSELRRFNLWAPRVSSLPKSVWNMKHLQHLKAGNSLAPFFKIVAPLDESDDDHNWDSYNEWCSCGNEGCARDEKAARRKLQKRVAAAATKEAKLDPNHGKGPYRGPWHQMQTLEIVGFDETSMADASHHLCNLRSLKLEDYWGLKWMMSLSKLACLEELSLHDMPSLSGLPHGVLGSPMLKKLTINNFRDPYAEGLNASWQGNRLRMTSLISLYITAFDRLKKPPALSQLPTLEGVYLGGMPELVLSADLFRIPRMRFLVLEDL